MKKKICIYTFSGILLLLLFISCEKEKTIPNVSTSPIVSITDSTVITGGNVNNEGLTLVTNRGVCWDTMPNPTILNPKTMDGAGIGNFTSIIKSFKPNTVYHVRAYAINSNGTAYGQDITFVTNKTAPRVSTGVVSLVNSTTANVEGRIIHNGGEVVIKCGVCWSTNQNPTILDNKITYNSNNINFECGLTGLSYYTTYYARAFAENSIGISYGPQISFRTKTEITAIDYDGNIYNAQTIGTLVWMIENLKTLHYRNGDAINNVSDGTIWDNLTTGAYCYYNNVEVNKDIYGVLYNWYAVGDSRKLAPEGWHVATDKEWRALYSYLGGNNIATGKMKIFGTNYDSNFNTGATNESNFSVIPNGMRFEVGPGHFQGLNGGAFFWCGNQCVTCSSTYAFSIWLSDICHFYADDVRRGFAVRCIKDY